MLRSIAGVALLTVAMVVPAVADPSDIKFPNNYEKEFVNYLNMDRANGKQSARIFANSIAVNSAQKSGEFPEGSILLMEVSKVKKGPDGKPVKSSVGRLIRDGKQAIVVMQKIKGVDEGLPEELRNDDWEFAVFSPQGKFLKKDTNACRACHAPLKDNRHVFTYEHLETANLSDYLISVSDVRGSSSGENNQKIVNKLLNSLTLPKEMEKEEAPKNDKIVAKVLGSISVDDPAKSKSTKAVVRKQPTEDKKVAALLGKIKEPATKGAAKQKKKRKPQFSQNLAIKRVIISQLQAFKGNKAARAFAHAAPNVRTNLRNSQTFMSVIKTSYPSVYFAKRAIFPPMKRVRGNQFIQQLILEKRNGGFVAATYLMVRVSGQWKIAGVDLKETARR